MMPIAGCWMRRPAGWHVSLGAALMAPHRSYLRVIRPLLDAGLHPRHGPHHRRWPEGQPAPVACLPLCIARLDPERGRRSADLRLPGRDGQHRGRGAVPRVQHGGRLCRRGTPEDRDAVLAAMPEARQIGEIVTEARPTRRRCRGFPADGDDRRAQPPDRRQDRVLRARPSAGKRPTC